MKDSVVYTLTQFLKLNHGREDSFTQIRTLAERFLIGYKATLGMKEGFDNSCKKLEEVKNQLLDGLNQAIPSLPDLLTQENTQDLLRQLEHLDLTNHIMESTYHDKIKHSQKQQQIENILSLSADSDALPLFLRGHILILDKNPNTRSSLSFRLENQGHAVYLAKESKEALAFLNQQIIDIVIVDGLSMDELTEDVWMYCLQEDSKVLILVVGSGDDSKLIANAFDKGAEDFITKPVNNVLLKARIQSALDKLLLHRLRIRKIIEFKEAMQELAHLIDDLEDVFFLLDHDNTIISHNKRVFDLFPHLQREYNTNANVEAVPSATETDVSVLSGQDFIQLLRTNFKHHVYERALQDNSEKYIKDIETKFNQSQNEWQERLANGHVLAYRLQTTPENNKILLIKEQTPTTLGRHHLAYLAYYDSLTGTVNRQFFIQRLEQMLNDAHHRIPVALIVIDLDGFKEVNDTHGHEMGDWVLQQVAQRLKTSVRQGDIVARFGGDEFTVLLKNLASEETIRTIAERMLESVCHPYVRGCATLTIGASMGIARYPFDTESPSFLINHADTAMYSVKQHGKNGLRFYHELVLPKNSIVH